MGYRLTLHFVDKETRSRAEGARLAFSLGHHAEVYADLSELIQHPPREGIVLARDDCAAGGVMGLLADLERAGISLPLIVIARDHDQRQADPRPLEIGEQSHHAARGAIVARKDDPLARRMLDELAEIGIDLGVMTK